MIDDLKELHHNDMLTIDNEICRQITGLEDFTINQIDYVQTDSEQIVLIEIDDYYLIATDIGGIEKFAICELFDEGISYLDSDESFLDKIKLKGGEGSINYICSDMSSTSESDFTFCEYTTNEDYYNYLIIQQSPYVVNVYRGVTIDENNIVL